MSRETWEGLCGEVLARWRRDLAEWRERGEHQIGSLIRDGIGDAEWLLSAVDPEGDEPEVLRRAVAHLRRAGPEMLEGMDRHSDEWTGTILRDVVEQFEARLAARSDSNGV